MKKVNSQKAQSLVEAAQVVLRNERYWSLVDVADRAESAESLAQEILDVFAEAEDECPADCAECKEHEENV